MESSDAPYGATPLDPSELEGLKFKNIATRGQLMRVICNRLLTIWLSETCPDIIWVKEPALVNVYSTRLSGCIC